MPTPMERYRKGAERALQELQMRQGLQQQQWGRGMAEKELGLGQKRLALSEARFEHEKDIPLTGEQRYYAQHEEAGPGDYTKHIGGIESDIFTQRTAAQEAIRRASRSTEAQQNWRDHISKIQRYNLLRRTRGAGLLTGPEYNAELQALEAHFKETPRNWDEGLEGKYLQYRDTVPEGEPTLTRAEYYNKAGFDRPAGQTLRGQQSGKTQLSDERILAGWKELGSLSALAMDISQSPEEWVGVDIDHLYRRIKELGLVK